MSMISAQCDKLRDTADKLDKTSVVSTPWIHYNLTPMMREAADTIWELRDDLQRANAAVQDAEHDESMAWDRVRKAEAENAKLRDLLAELYQCSRQYGCDRCGYKDGCTMFDRMAQLGIEVDA